jgi:hypothetical protein
MRRTSSECLWQNPTASTVIAERLAVDEKMTESERHRTCLFEGRTTNISFASSFSHVEFETAQSWDEAFAVYHNSRQRYRDLKQFAWTWIICLS